MFVIILSRSSGQLRNTLSRARELCERWRSGGNTPSPPTPTPDDEGGGRLARWFSVRRTSAHQYDMHAHEGDKMPKLPELEEDMFSCGGEVRGGRTPPPSLGPPPDSLSPVQLRRRHDYKKPLEESSPAILNAGKIQTLFHRLPDILQCHLHFRTALSDCARTWDRDEKIGEVFLNAFSKAVVLDVYSDFINNFSVAMELAKMESKRKSALADFFKVKQISAHDRLSFFGLMEFNQSGALSKCKPRRLLLLNDLVVCMNRSGSLRSTSSSTTGDSLCSEMSALMQDYETVSRMADLAASLHTPYQQLTPEVFRTLLQSIQQSIQKKDDEMAWVDSCCLQLTIRGRDEPLTFRANEPTARRAWATELRLAQLAQARANCGTRRRARSVLWVSSNGAAGSHVAVLTHRAASLKTLVTSIEHARGVRQVTTLCGDTVWLGTEDKKIIIFSGIEPEKQEKLTEVPTVAAVTQIKYHCDSMFVGLSNGRVSVFRRNHDDSWALQEPLAIELGDKPIHCILPVDGIIYAACAKRVFAINALTAEIMRILELKGEDDRIVKYLAHSGVGLWAAFSDSTFVSLYHTETLEHLQNIDIAADVAKTIGAREGSKPAHISALLAVQGLLWVGTTAGVSVTVPLPKLEGLPLIGGHIAVSYHAHAGPVTFLLPLNPDSKDVDVNVVRRNLSNARALAESGQEFKEEDGKDDEKHKLERRISEELSPYRPQRVQSAVIRRKKPGDVRLSKTLPKCANLNACDVYGLFGDLMFVKDCVGEADVNGSGGETLRRSDPELAAIPFRVSTLDRRLRMRAGRPRSLDLSSWSVDSRASSLCTSSGSEESMALRGVSRTSSGASGAASLAPLGASTPDSSSGKSSASERSIPRPDSANAPTSDCRPANKNAARSLRGADYIVGDSSSRRSILTIMGGRGYVDWRQTAEASERPVPAADPNPKDAHLILWETRL
ncbi:unnamed protein product [Leptidea sinapis]|uniref:DH domain-containing protein n=1 Tax=Leptidea sinapis TaxID=189913 RepID=A0A5E4PQT9_9NEOP|nr:unnamed protein product [Leptidea sinapis]